MLYALIIIYLIIKKEIVQNMGAISFSLSFKLHGMSSLIQTVCRVGIGSIDCFDSE
jgi:hypothetical protein